MPSNNRGVYEGKRKKMRVCAKSKFTRVYIQKDVFKRVYLKIYFVITTNF